MDKKILQLTLVVRKLNEIKDNNDKIFLVGGLVTLGRSSRDIDIVVKDKRDIPIVKKALGPDGKDIHFSILEKGSRPSSKVYLVVDKKEKQDSSTNMYGSI